MKEIKYFSKNDKGFSVDDIKLSDIKEKKKYKVVIKGQILIVTVLGNKLYILTEDNIVKYLVKVSKPDIEKFRNEIKEGLKKLGFKDGEKKVKTVKDLTNFIASNIGEIDGAIKNQNLEEYIRLNKEKLESEMIEDLIFEMKQDNIEQYNDIEGFYAKLRTDKDDEKSDFNDYPYEVYTKSKSTGEFIGWGDDLTKEGFLMYVEVPEIDTKFKNKKQIKEYLKKRYGDNAIL